MKPIHRNFQALIIILAAGLLLSSCVRPASKAQPTSPVPASGSSNSTPTFPLPGSVSQATLASLATLAGSQAASGQSTEVPVQTQPAPATATATVTPGMNVFFPLIFK